MTADHDTKTASETPPLLGALEWFCLGLCLVWLALGVYAATALGVFAASNEVALEKIMALIAIVFPVAIIAMVCAAARHQRALRQDARHLHQTVAHLQRAMETEARARRAKQSGVMEEQLVSLAKSAAQTESTLATFVSARKPRASLVAQTAPAPLDQENQTDQAELFGLEDPPVAKSGKQVDQSTLITALHFPSNSDDKAGFAALRASLADRRYRPLIYAAQDVLTRLAQDEIYMDSLTVDRTRPEVWRKFAEGERGPLVSSVGGIRDRAALALASRALKNDPLFRDTAHQFVQKFDALLSELSPDMDDGTLLKLTNTRSAHAFMLVGRVLGLFS